MKIRIWVMLTALASATLVLLGGMTTPPATPGGATVRWMGSYSQIEKPRVVLITDGTSWEALWREHMGGTIEKNANGFETWPSVDFSTHCVVGVFAGAAANSNGYEIESVEDLGDIVRVRCDQIQFQTASFDGKDSGCPTTAFGLFVIPRSDRTIVLEENVQGLIGGPPVWKERARFPAAPKAQTIRGH